MKGHNNCAWLKVGELEPCGKSCLGEYCKVHLARLRRGRSLPIPCRNCGRGVQGEIQLCRACGREKIPHQHTAIKQETKREFSLVLAQLLAIRTPIWTVTCQRYTHRIMDDCINQILEEMPDSPLHDIAKNIMDEPVPETVKARLLQPLRPGIYHLPPLRKTRG